MKKAVIALLGSSALMLSTAGIAGGSTAAHSANMDVNNAAGVYISGNLGYGNVDVDLPNNPNITNDRNGFAWSTAIGYQFNPYLAVEGGYIQFADITAHSNVNSSSARVSTYGADIAVKGIYPINDQFSVFGKVGAAYLSHSLQVGTQSETILLTDSVHHVVPLFGLGASYNITPKWSVQLQGLATPSSGDDFPATYTGLVGVSYKFS